MKPGPDFCLAMAVVVIMVTIVVAFGSCFFQLPPPLLCLLAVLTMTPLGFAQLLFRLLDAPLAFIVTVFCISRDSDANQQRCRKS